MRKMGGSFLEPPMIKGRWENSEREQDSPVEMGASNIAGFKETLFTKAKRRRPHSVVSGVRVKERKDDPALRDYMNLTSSLESFHWALRCLMRLTSDALSSLIGLSIQFSSFGGHHLLRLTLSRSTLKI
ncbi:hypothetical protein TNCV_1135991 [Trichonephila clavipes]|nr:hypothetical protein TNCV_1135991 [Trichonephila clavipes]